MNTAIAKKRINQVLRIDSIDSTDSDFLATHVPFRKIVVQNREISLRKLIDLKNIYIGTSLIMN